MPPAEQLTDGGLVPSEKTKRFAGPIGGGEELLHELDRLLALGLVEDKALDELGPLTRRR